MTAALEVAVARRLGEFELDVAFTVESGMSVLFGPSGAGKSLTLALIAGLVRPDPGTIAINGAVVTDRARRIYVSPQERRDRHGLPGRPAASRTAPCSTTSRSPSARQRDAGHGGRSPARGSNGSVPRRSPTGGRARSRAASASGSRSRAGSPATRRSCCSTSRSRRSTTRSAASCAG